MRYDYGGSSHSVQLEALGEGRFRAQIAERQIEFVAYQLADGGWQIDLGGEVLTAYSEAAGQERFVAINGDHYVLVVAEEGPSRPVRSSAGDLTAQMPGQVSELRIQEGDRVEAGQTLLIIEAMKMEIRINAPQAGRITRLLVSLGDSVERGQALLEIGD